MNAGAMIAIHAAAAAKARADVLDAFRLKGATAPERARSLFDLDEAAFIAQRDGAGRASKGQQLAMVAVALGLMLLGGVLVFFLKRQS